VLDKMVVLRCQRSLRSDLLPRYHRTMDSEPTGGESLDDESSDCEADAFAVRRLSLQ
jgi:hypothetical protein